MQDAPLISPQAVRLPPTTEFPPTPMPPTTCSAPEFVEVDAVELLTNNTVSMVAVPYILVPPNNFAIVFYLLTMYYLDL